MSNFFGICSLHGFYKNGGGGGGGGGAGGVGGVGGGLHHPRL